jgi:Gas vesicle synthesis protein GvpL/GvpF
VTHLLLHAITLTSDSAAYAIEGLRGAQLVTFEAGGLTAWATELPAKADGFAREDLLSHHRVVTDICARVEAVLPARFPGVSQSADALRTQLESRQTELMDQLAKVRGCCELAVTALWTNAGQAAIPAPAEGVSPGRRYMLHRQVALAGTEQRQTRARELANELERLAGSDLVKVQRKVCPSEHVALSLALLVRRVDSAAVYARLPRSSRDVRILLNGPWPPYTFAAVRSD